MLQIFSSQIVDDPNNVDEDDDGDDGEVEDESKSGFSGLNIDPIDVMLVDLK
jgi:hypothetical protein